VLKLPSKKDSYIMSTSAAESALHPINPHDFWGQPDQAAAQAKAMTWIGNVEPYREPLVAAADMLLHFEQNTPTADQDILLWNGQPHHHLPFESADDLVHCVLDGLVRERTGGRQFVARVDAFNFLGSNRRSHGSHLALGNIDDARPPQEYATGAVEIAEHNGYRAFWRQRLPDDVIASKIVESQAAAMRNAQRAEIESRAEAIDLALRTKLLEVALGVAAAILGSDYQFDWAGNKTPAESAILAGFSTNSYERGGATKDLEDARERAAAGIVPRLDALLKALAALLPGDDPEAVIRRLQ
jgi:hypothetical protein